MSAGSLAMAVRVGETTTAVAVLRRAELLVLELDVAIERVEATEGTGAELAAELNASAMCARLMAHLALRRVQV